MSTGLEGLFGSPEEQAEKVAQAEDFINRYSTGDPKEGYTQEEAAQALQGVSKVATPEQMKVALEESINNLSPEDRAQFAEMLKQRQAGAGMVDIQKSGERTAVEPGAQAAEGGGGLDDLLGGLLGGGSGGGGLGDVLGGLLGGQTATAQTGATAGQAEGGGGGLMDMLGDLASSPTGKAVMAGAAAFAMKNILGSKG